MNQSVTLRLTSLPPVIQHWDSKTPLGPFKGLYITAFPGYKQVPQPVKRKVPVLRKSVNFRAASCVPKDFATKKCEKQECMCAWNIYWTHSCSKTNKQHWQTVIGWSTAGVTLKIHCSCHQTACKPQTGNGLQWSGWPHHKSFHLLKPTVNYTCNTVETLTREQRTVKSSFHHWGMFEMLILGIVSDSIDLVAWEAQAKLESWFIFRLSLHLH